MTVLPTRGPRSAASSRMQPKLLPKQKGANLKNAFYNNGPRARVQQSAASQQTKRAAQNQARRTGAPVQNNKQGNGKGKVAAKSNRGGKPILNGVKQNLRKNGD